MGRAYSPPLCPAGVHRHLTAGIDRKPLAELAMELTIPCEIPARFNFMMKIQIQNKFFPLHDLETPKCENCAIAFDVIILIFYHD